MRTSYGAAPKLIGISSGTEEDVVESQVLRNNAGSAVWGQNCRQVALHPGGHDGLVLRTVAINLESRLGGIELCGHCECKSESKLATFSNFDATVVSGRKHLIKAGDFSEKYRALQSELAIIMTPGW